MALSGLFDRRSAWKMRTMPPGMPAARSDARGNLPRAGTARETPEGVRTRAANLAVTEPGRTARFRHERLRYKSRIPGRANSLSKPQRDGDDQNQEDAVGRRRSIVEGPQLRQDLD